MYAVICLALIGSSLAVATGPTVTELDGRIEQHQQELNETRGRLGEIRERISRLEQNEAFSLAKVEAYREQIAVTRKYLVQLTTRIDDRTREIVQTSTRIASTEAKVEARKQDLRRRLTNIYKYGRLLPLETIFATSTVPDIARRMHYLRYVARADIRMAGELEQLNQQLTGQRNRLLVARTELERLRQEREREDKELQTARSSEAALLDKVRSESRSKRELEAELNEAMNNLQSLLAQLEEQRKQVLVSADSHYFTLNKGKLPWPVRGKVIAAFGSKVHPRYKTTTSNRGIDIQAQAGTPAQAIAAGKVAYADQFMGYGKLVILDHGGGFYTLYANLDEISAMVGSQLSTGTAVGRTREYLHFELRREGQPTNPLDWLQE